MIDPKTTVFCNNIGVYKGQLTKRKSYLVEAVNSENVRILNDQGQLKWYDAYYFDWEKQPEIRSISLDDRIENAASDLIEVTIEFADGTKYWTSFTTPQYLVELLKVQLHITTNNFIIINELTENKIKEVILDLDEQNKLSDSCKTY